MASLENIKILLPENLRGDFAFYPMIILAVTVVLLLACGLYEGFKKYGRGMAANFQDERASRFLGGLCFVQTLCLLLIVLSVFSYYKPTIQPGGYESELGVGIAVTMGAFAFLVFPAILKLADSLFFLLAEVPGIVFGFSRAACFRPGCVVVQTVQKHSRNPGPRAREVRPEKHGDYIDYVVDKFRRVLAVRKGKITLVTRRGKLLNVRIDDPLLRKPSLFERLKFYRKFPPKEMALGSMGISCSG